jgi:uncharacterized protein
VIVVLDSGVWVSALAFGGTPRLAVEKAVTVDQLAICDLIQDELARILGEKIGWNHARVVEDMQLYLEKAIWVLVLRELHGVCRDPKDDMILECAINAKAEIIVTGDKDLLVLKEYRGVRIRSPREYVAGL